MKLNDYYVLFQNPFLEQILPYCGSEAIQLRTNSTPS